MKKVKSSKPKKQRRFHYEKELHAKQHGLAGHLDKKLRGELGIRSVSLRKGDTVRVVRGARKGSSGKIESVDYGKGVVFIEKLTRKKANGEEVRVPVHASKVLVLDVDKSDAKRFKGKKAGKEGRAGKEEKREA